MIYGIDERVEVRHSQESPCTGPYTLLVPEDRERSRPLGVIRVAGVAVARGLYRLRLERVGDA